MTLSSLTVVERGKAGSVFGLVVPAVVKSVEATSGTSVVGVTVSTPLVDICVVSRLVDVSTDSDPVVDSSKCVVVAAAVVLVIDSLLGPVVVFSDAVVDPTATEVVLTDRIVDSDICVVVVASFVILGVDSVVGSVVVT